MPEMLATLPLVTAYVALPHNADIVMFIYRDEVYNPNSERRGYADIIVSKHRNGPTGQIVLRFEPETTRFRDLMDEVVPPLHFEQPSLNLEEDDDNLEA